MLRFSSAQKMAIARLASGLVLAARKTLGFPNQTISKRGGITWNLDLAEGIDLSIFLLGAFEPSTVRLYRKWVRPGAVVLDLGANIGAHTLPLARLAGPEGRVIAIEPTGYAIRKLRSNISLNPVLTGRITICQVMLVAEAGRALSPELYSSWPLIRTREEVHGAHGGKLMDTQGATAMTLDQLIQSTGINHIDFIKMDVDGHEHEVLLGGSQTIATHRPPILMELAPYLHQEGEKGFEGMLNLIERCQYTMREAGTNQLLPFDPALLRLRIPHGRTCNVLLEPLHRSPGAAQPQGKANSTQRREDARGESRQEY
jgi:FkbM family methyltransferase